SENGLAKPSKFQIGRQTENSHLQTHRTFELRPRGKDALTYLTPAREATREREGTAVRNDLRSRLNALNMRDFLYLRQLKKINVEIFWPFIPGRGSAKQ